MKANSQWLTGLDQYWRLVGSNIIIILHYVCMHFDQGCDSKNGLSHINSSLHISHILGGGGGGVGGRGRDGVIQGIWLIVVVTREIPLAPPPPPPPPPPKECAEGCILHGHGNYISYKCRGRPTNLECKKLRVFLFLDWVLLPPPANKQISPS